VKGEADASESRRAFNRKKNLFSEEREANGIGAGSPTRPRRPENSAASLSASSQGKEMISRKRSDRQLCGGCLFVLLVFCWGGGCWGVGSGGGVGVFGGFVGVCCFSFVFCWGGCGGGALGFWGGGGGWRKHQRAHRDSKINDPKHTGLGGRRVVDGAVAAGEKDSRKKGKIKKLAPAKRECLKPESKTRRRKEEGEEITVGTLVPHSADWWPAESRKGRPIYQCIWRTLGRDGPRAVL